MLLTFVRTTLITDVVLPVVGALFALYLVGMTVLVLLTVALKLTASHGSHRLVLDLVAVEDAAPVELPPAVLPASNIVV